MEPSKKMGDNLSSVPADDLDEVIANATALSKSLTQTANEYVATLWMVKSKAFEIEADLKKYRAEMARLEIEIEQRKQEHQQLEASLANLRAHIAQHHQDKAGYVKRLDEMLLQAAKDREDLQRRIKLTLARAA
jgi:chromosome segregation ATPase